eukprot:321738-Prymnesium_polylepis.1
MAISPAPPSCPARLIRQLSAAACTPNVSFGCDEHRGVWAARGCRGVFRCSGRTPRGGTRCMSDGSDTVHCGCKRGWSSVEERARAWSAVIGGVGRRCVNGSSVAPLPMVDATCCVGNCSCRVGASPRCARCCGCTHLSRPRAAGFSFIRLNTTFETRTAPGASGATVFHAMPLDSRLGAADEQLVRVHNARGSSPFFFGSFVSRARLLADVVGRCGLRDVHSALTVRPVRTSVPTSNGSLVVGEPGVLLEEAKGISLHSLLESMSKLVVKIPHGVSVRKEGVDGVRAALLQREARRAAMVLAKK